MFKVQKEVGQIACMYNAEKNKAVPILPLGNNLTVYSLSLYMCACVYVDVCLRICVVFINSE